MVEIQDHKLHLPRVGWVDYSVLPRHVTRLSPTHRTVLQNAVRGWLGESPYGKYDNLAYKAFGIPTIMLGICCSFDQQGALQVLSIDPRGYGLGTASYFNPSLGERVEKLIKYLAYRLGMPIRFILAKDKAKADDGLYLDTIDHETALMAESALVARGLFAHNDKEKQRRVREQYKRLSLVPLEHGGRRYGIGMGLWRSVDIVSVSRNETIIAYGNGEPLDIAHSAFVFRPVDADVTPRLRFLVPEELRRRAPSGCWPECYSRLDDVMSAIDATAGGFVAQPYVPSMTLIGDEYASVFYGHAVYNPYTGDFEVLGGLVCSSPRPNPRIRGHVRGTVLSPFVFG